MLTLLCILGCSREQAGDVAYPDPFLWKGEAPHARIKSKECLKALDSLSVKPKECWEDLFSIRGWDTLQVQTKEWKGPVESLKEFGRWSPEHRSSGFWSREYTVSWEAKTWFETTRFDKENLKDQVEGKREFFSEWAHEFSKPLKEEEAFVIDEKLLGGKISSSFLCHKQEKNTWDFTQCRSLNEITAVQFQAWLNKLLGVSYNGRLEKKWEWFRQGDRLLLLGLINNRLYLMEGVFPIHWGISWLESL